jgi:predicted Zn-ribbon and HTH transcriptional regulator
MKRKPKEPIMPQSSHDTVRQSIMQELENGFCSAKDLSAIVKIPEREVYGHLEHIQKTLASSGRRLLIRPAECKKCGFLFSKRDRMKKPGKCPICREELIKEPLFGIERTGSFQY